MTSSSHIISVFVRVPQPKEDIIHGRKLRQSLLFSQVYIVKWSTTVGLMVIRFYKECCEKASSQQNSSFFYGHNEKMEVRCYITATAFVKTVAGTVAIG